MQPANRLRQPIRLRQHSRSGAVAFVALGVLGTSAAAPATPASAAPTTHTAILSASVSSRQASPYTDIRARLAAVRTTYSSMLADAYSVHAGTAVKLTGAVALGDQSVVWDQPVGLQVRTGDSWQTVASQRLSSDGRAVFTVNPTRSTSYRISYAGDGPLGASTSAPTTIGVTAPPPSPSPSADSGPGSASGSAPGSAPAVSSASGRAARVVALAAAQSGKRYQFGAAGPNAFDCSGLTQYVFRAVGITLPHQANAQLSHGKPVSRAAASPGDLVFFLSGSHAYHVGIYAGGNEMYDAPNPSQRVGRHKIWTSNVVFRRIV